MSVSFTVRDNITRRTVPTDHNFWRETRAEADSNRGPFTYQPAALPLGQTGSLLRQSVVHLFIGCYKLQTRGSRHPPSNEGSRKCEDTVQLTNSCLKSSFSGISVVQQSSQKRHLGAQLNLFLLLLLLLLLRLFLEEYCIKNWCKMFFGSERVSDPC